MSLTVPDLPDDVTNLDAALAYAAAGWYVVPIKRGTKHPGSVLGKGWHTKSSRDPHQVADWFIGNDHGIALHVGRSGAVVFDVDHPDEVPEVLRQAFVAQAPPRQNTRPADPRIGHVLYLQPADRLVGNGNGQLGKAFGEVRGSNGVIVVAPSTHPAPDGHYAWHRTGTVPAIPQTIADLLPGPAATHEDAVSDATVEAFLDSCTSNARPALGGVPLQRMTRDIDAGGSRHAAAIEATCWAMREAGAGLYPARPAHDQLRQVFLDAVARPGKGSHQGEARRGAQAAAEWAGIMSFAVAQAMADDSRARREAIEQRAPHQDLAGLIAPPPESPPPPDEPAVADAQTPADEPLGPTLLPIRPLADIAAEVDARGPRQWLIRGVWPAGDYGVHGADPKAGKTWNAADLAISVASGTDWLGRFPIDTPGPVILFAGEGGDGNVVRRLRAVANARGLVADELPIYVCTRAPKLADAAHMAILEDWVARVRPSLVILDPLYLAAAGADGKDLYGMGALLEKPQHVCQAHGAALFVVTHFNRNRDAKGAGRFTGAGPAEWGRVLIAATVSGRHGDPATKETTVVTLLEITGGEVPDQDLSLRRKIRADDPNDLDSPLQYATDFPATDDAIAGPNGSDLQPAAKKLLEALDGQVDPAPIGTLVDSIAAKYGHGLKRPTCSTHLNQLRERGLADFLDLGAGREKLWFRVRPALEEVA